MLQGTAVDPCSFPVLTQILTFCVCPCFVKTPFDVMSLESWIRRWHRAFTGPFSMSSAVLLSNTHIDPGHTVISWGSIHPDWLPWKPSLWKCSWVPRTPTVVCAITCLAGALKSIELSDEAGACWKYSKVCCFQVCPLQAARVRES